MKFTNFLKLCFSRRAFLQAELDHHDRLKAENPAWGEADPKEYDSRICKKRRGLGVSFLLVVTIIVGGAVSATVVNSYVHLPGSVVRGIQITAITIIAWSVLSRIGYESPSMKGITLLEITSEFGFKFMYLLGIFLGTGVLFLESAA